MNEALSSAHTWFLESSAQGPNGDLVIHLVEGVKGTERLPVEVVSGTVLGHYFPVTITPDSRCATVHFSDARAVFAFAESYDREDPQLKLAGDGLARRADASSLREFVRKRTTALEDHRGEFSEWVVWTKDQVFQVFAGSPPEIQLNGRAPDFTIERGNTWSAS